MKMFTCFYLALVVALLILPFNSVAEDERNKVGDDTNNVTLDSLETIQIRGIRGSLLRSINTKRNNDAIVDVITAEDIGKFPDKNVAEALQRVTGVSLTRVQGEGERIGVRGTAPSQNRTYINGQNIASADWWTSSTPNRGFNYSLLPAEVVSSLDVSKSPEADHDEGSLGGSINIKTHTPLSTKDDMFIGTAQLQYSDLSGKTDPQFSLLYNGINDDNTFGVLLSLSHHERNLRRDGLESWGWTERNFNYDNQGDLIISQDEQADLTGIWSAGGGGSAIFKQRRILSSVMATVQYQPDLQWNIELNALYSQLSANNSNQNFLWQPSTVFDREGVIGAHQIIDNTLVFAQYKPVSVTNATGLPFNTAMEAIWRQSAIQTSLVHLLVDYDRGYWHSQYQIGISQASGGTSKDFTSQWSANTEYQVNLTQQQNIIANYQLDPLQASAWQISEVRQDKKRSVDEEIFAQGDFELQLDHPFFQSIKVGSKLKSHRRSFTRFRSVNGGYQGVAGDLNWTLADFPASLPSDFLQNIGSEQTLKNYSYADISVLKAAYTELSFFQVEEKPSSFDIKEDTLAAYIKMNFSGPFYRGNFGLRALHTRQSASAFQRTDVNLPFSDDALWQTKRKNYSDILPSINFAIDWSDDVVVRLSTSKVMSRPEYHHLMPSTNYNVTQAQGAGGNPELSAFRATNFDLGIEWYFNDTGIFSIAAFHKDVQSFIDIQRYQEVYEGVNMVINRPVNGSGGVIYGAELNLQKEFFYGLGVIANYTYVQGERKDSYTGENIDIPGNSEHTVNLTSYFENQWLSARLSYNYRTEFATGLGEEITASYGQWDVNVSLLLTGNMSLVLEAINLSDEQLYTYERNEYAPVGVYKNGRRLYAGFRLSY